MFGHPYAVNSARGRAGVRLGHHASAMLMVLIVAVVIVGLFPPPGLLALTMPLSLFAFVLISWLLMRQHDRRLCEQCAGEMPLDPAARAQKLHNRFWTAHTGAEPRFLVPYTVVLIGSNFATTSIGRAGWAVMQLSMVYLILSQRTHRTLQPWCPWCSDGGGGQKVDEPPPVVPHDDHQLT